MDYWTVADELPLQPFAASTALGRSEMERLAAGETFLLAEKVNIDRAITFCLRENWVQEAARLVDRAFRYLDIAYSHDRVVQVRELVREAAFAEGDELVAWRSQLDLVTQRITRGVTEEILAEYTRCAEAFEAMGAHAELATVLGALTFFTMVHTGQPQVELAERAVVAARASGVQGLYANNLRELGTVLSSAGDYAESVRVLEEALAIGLDGKRPGDVALVLSRMTAGALVHGDLERASAWCRQALDVITEFGDIRGVGYCTVQLSQVDLALGDAGSALASAEKALSIFEGLGERRGTARALPAVAEANLALGLTGKVIEVATAALEDQAVMGDADAEERLRAALEQARRQA